MAENDAKKKEKMIGSTTDRHQKEGNGDDVLVNQGDPGDSSIMKEDDAKKEKMISSTSDHLQKDGIDDSSRLALMSEDGPSDAMELMNAIKSTPKKRKEPTTSTKTRTAVTVKRFDKINVKVPKKESSAVAVTVGGAAAAAENNSSDSDASSILLIEGQGCSSPTSGLLPKYPPETDGKN